MKKQLKGGTNVDWDKFGMLAGLSSLGFSILVTTVMYVIMNAIMMLQI